jgi:hypothetical protein
LAFTRFCAVESFAEAKVEFFDKRLALVLRRENIELEQPTAAG